MYTVTVIDIAHEALIQHWTLLRQWLTENREFKAWRDRLALAGKDYRENNHDKDLLLRGAKLAEAEEKLKHYQAELNQQEIGFIEASSLARRQQLQAETRRRRWLIIGLVGVSLIVSGSAGFSFW